MLYLIGCILCWGACNFMNKLSSSRINPLFMQIVFAGVATILIPFYFYLSNKLQFSNKWDSQGIIFSALGAFGSILGSIFLYSYIAKGNALGTSLAFVSLYPVVSLLLSVAFLGERLTLMQGISITVMMTGAVMLGLNK